jgi:hypothetical protein
MKRPPKGRGHAGQRNHAYRRRDSALELIVSTSSLTARRAFFSCLSAGGTRKIICTEDHKGHKDNPFDRNGLRLEPPLVSCPRNTRYFAGGQLAVFQGASEAPISLSYGSSEAANRSVEVILGRVDGKRTRSRRSSSGTIGSSARKPVHLFIQAVIPCHRFSIPKSNNSPINIVWEKPMELDENQLSLRGFSFVVVSMQARGQD